MKVTIFGTGYVGLITGACLAEVGHEICCVDTDSDKIATLSRGEVAIYEPGLADLVAANLRTGHLQFTTDAATGVAHGKVLFIAVGTPADEDGSADLRHVLAVAAAIAEQLDAPRIIVNKSTVPVGTADQVREHIQTGLRHRGREALQFTVVSNPEFLKEGSAVNDFMEPDRIIVGSDDDAARRVMRELYLPFNRSRDRTIEMDIRSAELTKYAANVMLAARISLMNEFAHLAERLDADIEEVRIGIGSDPRIGPQFIYPGCGYGGSCFPKDVSALARTAAEVGFDAPVLQGVETTNERQKVAIVQHIRSHFGDDLSGHRFAVWGLAFKPNTDDMRAAPSRAIVAQLWAAGAHVQAYDPVALEAARSIWGERPDLTCCTDREQALRGADALIIVTEWNEFKSADHDLLKSCLRTPVVFDGRNIYDPAAMEQAGITYYGIGRGRSRQTRPPLLAD